jgi:hypothetical protein
MIKMITTLEQMLTIRGRVVAVCDAVAYGDPQLHNGSWVVGFKQHKEIMALQVNVRDREISNESELYKAEIDLEKAIRGAILMST